MMERRQGRPTGTEFFNELGLSFDPVHFDEVYSARRGVRAGLQTTLKLYPTRRAA